MPLSQGSVSNGPNGLTLKAWVLFDGITGARVSGSVNATATARGSAGVYSITLSGGGVDTDLVIVRASAPAGANGQITQKGRVTGATSAQVQTELAGVPADVRSVHVEIFG
jgi:hypothetical protein